MLKKAPLSRQADAGACCRDDLLTASCPGAMMLPGQPRTKAVSDAACTHVAPYQQPSNKEVTYLHFLEVFSRRNASILSLKGVFTIRMEINPLHALICFVMPL